MGLAGLALGVRPEPEHPAARVMASPRLGEDVPDTEVGGVVVRSIRARRADVTRLERPGDGIHHPDAAGPLNSLQSGAKEASSVVAAR